MKGTTNRYNKQAGKTDDKQLNAMREVVLAGLNTRSQANWWVLAGALLLRAIGAAAGAEQMARESRGAGAPGAARQQARAAACAACAASLDCCRPCPRLATAAAGYRCICRWLLVQQLGGATCCHMLIARLTIKIRQLLCHGLRLYRLPPHNCCRLFVQLSFRVRQRPPFCSMRPGCRHRSADALLPLRCRTNLAVACLLLQHATCTPTSAALAGHLPCGAPAVVCDVHAGASLPPTGCHRLPPVEYSSCFASPCLACSCAG